MALEFEWDRREAASNRRKQAVSFEEATTVFGDPLASIFEDEGHSVGELRELIFGHSSDGRLLIVSFTERDERIRIISAREATKKERRKYEEEHET